MNTKPRYSNINFDSVKRSFEIRKKNNLDLKRGSTPEEYMDSIMKEYNGRKEENPDIEGFCDYYLGQSEHMTYCAMSYIAAIKKAKHLHDKMIFIVDGSYTTHRIWSFVDYENELYDITAELNLPDSEDKEEVKNEFYAKDPEQKLEWLANNFEYIYIQIPRFDRIKDGYDLELEIGYQLAVNGGY